MTKTAKSEATGYLIAREAAGSRGTPPSSGWRRMQPNPGGIQGHEPEFVDAVRDPLSKFATDEKPDHVGLNANPTLVHDLNKDFADMFAEGWTRSAAKVPGDEPTTAIYYPTAAADGAGSEDSFTVAADGDLTAGLLIYVRGCQEAANNGVFKLSGTSGTTAIKVATGTLTAETITQGTVTLEVCGVEGAEDDIVMDSSGNLTSTTLDFTTLGLVDGHEVKIGDTALDADFGFATEACNCWATVDGTPTANLLPLKWHSSTPAADSGTGKTIRIHFGRAYRNVAIDHADYLEPSWHIEKEDLGVGTAEAAVYTYVKGATIDKVSIAMAVESKIVVTTNFKAMDIADPVLVASRVSGPSAAYPSLASEMFDTSNDLIQCGVYTTADAVLIAEVNSFTYSIDHAVDPQKQLGTFGAADMNFGKIRPLGVMEVYYRRHTLPVGIRANTTYRQTTRMRNGQAGISLHIPQLVLRGGAMSYTANKPVMVNVNLPSHRDPATNQVMILNILPYCPLV